MGRPKIGYCKTERISASIDRYLYDKFIQESSGQRSRLINTLLKNHYFPSKIDQKSGKIDQKCTFFEINDVFLDRFDTYLPIFTRISENGKDWRAHNFFNQFKSDIVFKWKMEVDDNLVLEFLNNMKNALSII